MNPPISMPYSDLVSYTDEADFRAYLEARRPDNWLKAALEWFSARDARELLGDPSEDEVLDWLDYEFKPSDHPRVRETLRREFKPRDIWADDELDDETRKACRHDLYHLMQQVRAVAYKFDRVNWAKLRKDELIRRALDAKSELLALANECEAKGKAYAKDANA